MEKHYNVPMSRDLLNKNHCIAMGTDLHSIHKFTNIDVIDIAKELYAHAYV